MIFWILFYFIFTPLFVYYNLRNNVIKRKIVSLIDRFVACFDSYPSLKQPAIFLSYALESFAVVLFVQHFYFGHFMIPTGSMEPTIQLRDHYIVNMFKNKFFAPQLGEIYILKNPLGDKTPLCKRLVALPGEKIEIIGDALFINDKRRFEREYSNASHLSLIGDSSWIVPKKGDTLSLRHAIFISDSKVIDISEARRLYAKLGKKFFSIYTLESANFILNGRLTGPIFEQKLVAKLLKGDVILKEDYYFFLGDNTHASKDSRKFGFISRSSVKGELRLRLWPLNRFKVLNKD